MDTQELIRRYRSIPLFDGFPYLVTKVAGAMHHLIALPDVGTPYLERLALRQYAANRLPTCLVLAPDAALYLSEGCPEPSAEPPRCDLPVFGRLQPPEEFIGRELFEREERLRLFAGGRTSGFLVDRPRGRRATPADRLRLSGAGPDGVPNGLERCGVCGRWRGEALLEKLDLVVAVFCRCDNHNRCARCLQLLADRRLDGAAYFEDEGKVLHVPAFMGLRHDCADL